MARAVWQLRAAVAVVLGAAALGSGSVSGSGRIVEAALAAGAVPSSAPIVEHDAVECMVAGRYPLLPACFRPADQVARGRVYFQAEGATTWHYVEMKSDMPCWSGVLPKPTKALIKRHVNYYVETITRTLGSARTPEYSALVVGSAEECERPKVAAFSPAGPAAVQPFLPSGFAVGGGLLKPLVMAGAGAAVGGAVVVTQPGSPGPDPIRPGPLPTPTPVPVGPTPNPNPTPTPPGPTPTPTPTPDPNPTPTPAPTPSPTPAPSPTPGPGALSAACTASPQSGVAPLPVQFTVTAQGGTGTYTYLWAFGDTGSSGVPNPTHTYAGAGAYAPTVQVRSGSEQVTCSKAVAVAPPATPTFPLTVSRQGPGSGVVTSSPAGIDCGSTCTAVYPQGTVVSLTALPDASSVFAGWSGACSGTGACTVTMDAAKAVSARFNVATFVLTVTKTGLGLLGTITSSPAGISCGLLCTVQTATFTAGTVVTLAANPALLAAFQGWSGDCTGSGACVVTMNADRSVNGAFSLLAPEPSHPDAAAGPSHPEAAGGDVDLGLMRSVLRSPQARGEVTLNGRMVLVTREGGAEVGLRAQPGNNLVEAWVREAAGSGLWRFEFDPGAIETGSLRVLAGEPLAVAPNSVTFRLNGRPGERVSFAVRFRGARAN